MLKLDHEQRKVLVQALPAAANLGLGAMMFGQFLRDQPFSWGMAVAGIGIWIIGVTFAIWLAGGQRWMNR
jgi:hypothetical protein